MPDPQASQPDWTIVAKKTPEEMTHIAETVKANFLFAHLNEAQRTTIFEVMQKVNVVADEVSPERHLVLPRCSRVPMLMATVRGTGRDRW